MIKLRAEFAEKDRISHDKLNEVFEFKNKKSPYIILDCSYWLFGDLPERIPEDYCGDNPDVMFKFQLERIKEHYATKEYENDCYVGFLMPWFGTGVLASAFGTPVEFLYKMDPAVNMSSMKHPEEIDSLIMPDPNKRGLMPRVLEQIKYFKKHCDLPIGVTDCQGPLTTALSIIGYENFIYWMYEHPDAIHKLMNMCADALIDWVRVQKDCIGVAHEEPGYVLGLSVPKGRGGVWISDDDSVIFSSELYRDFVKPYNEKILLALGGGGIHYCGNSNQNLDSYMRTKGLNFLHILQLDNFEATNKVRKACMENGKVLFLGDFTPTDERLDAYFDEMIRDMDQCGLIVSSYIAPAIALNKGAYIEKPRDYAKLGRRVAGIIEEKQKKYLSV